jgi:hypothetical protein
MPKQITLTAVFIPMLALLVGAAHYDPAVKAPIEKVQQNSSGKTCPPGKMWNPNKRMCE